MYVCKMVGMYVCKMVGTYVCMYVCMHVCMYASDDDDIEEGTWPQKCSWKTRHSHSHRQAPRL